MKSSYYKTKRTILIIDSEDSSFTPGLVLPVYMDDISTFGVFDNKDIFRSVRMLKYAGVDWEYIKE